MYASINDATKFEAVCNRSAEQLLKSVFIIIPLITISYSQISLGAFYAYFVHGRLTTPIGALLPLTSDDSQISFIINSCHQSVMAIFALFGSIGIEVVACLINNAVTLIPEIILLNMNELGRAVATQGWSIKTKVQLRNILVQIQDFDR